MIALPWERESKNLEDSYLQSLGKNILFSEAEELRRAAERLGPELVEAARAIHDASGRLVVVGMGKSGLIGRKIAATFASLGTPAFFLHAAEGAHGDLGMVCREDVGLFLSNSGETRETLEILPYFKRLGAVIIALTGNPTSRLAQDADIVIDTEVTAEADPLGLAPTSSTTLQLAVGDALAGMVTELRGIKKEDFAMFHPGGSLGRRLLLRVEDVMGSRERLPLVGPQTFVREAIFEMTSKSYGAAIVVDDRGRLLGIFTDGDLRRLLEDQGPQGMGLRIEDVMTKSPKFIQPEKLAVEAVHLMEEAEISCLAVVKDEVVVGIVHIHDLLKAGVA